jgi:multisubunit Na+/H+ antiporter MnhC subunit
MTEGLRKALNVIFWTSVVLSIVHYTDNTVRFSAYDKGDPFVSGAWQIVLAWVILTAIGVLAYLRTRQERWWPAVAFMGVYSLVGLVSFGHYTFAPVSEYDALQNTLILTDIVSGLSVLGFALWLMFRRAIPVRIEAERVAVR